MGVELTASAAVEPWPRCADWARQVAVDPVGTAVHARGWLLLDWPQPWPRDAAEVVELAPVRDALAGTGIRLQLVVPRPDVDGSTVVLHHGGVDGDGGFSGYHRRSRTVEPPAVIDAALALVDERDDVSQPDAPQPDAGQPDAGQPDAGQPDAGQPDAGQGRPIRDRVDGAVDVLICGHGSRDRCCGSMGTGLAMTASAAGVLVSRTSHTGGHRFAPTGIVLPQGTAWAFLDDAALARIVARAGPVDDLLDRYRGSVALATPTQQAAERVAFAAVGWPWLDHRRRAVDLADGRVRVDAIAPDGHHRSWVIELAEGRRLPVPDCGHDPSAAPKSQSEVVVTAVEETSGP